MTMMCKLPDGRRYNPEIMNAFRVEVTDTFGRDANYCWVHEHFILRPRDDKAGQRSLVREAKALEGWTGERCETHDHGLEIEVRPRRACMIMFIMWCDPGGYYE